MYGHRGVSINSKYRGVFFCIRASLMTTRPFVCLQGWPSINRCCQTRCFFVAADCQCEQSCRPCALVNSSWTKLSFLYALHFIRLLVSTCIRVCNWTFE